MGITTPDNLVYPDGNNPVAVTSAMATLANTTQTALNRRGNSYVGTTAQRLAFTTAANGVLWSDTDNERLVYRRNGSLWTEIMPVDSGWSAIPSNNGWTVDARQYGKTVELRFLSVPTTVAANVFTTFATLPAYLSIGANNVAWGSCYKFGGSARVGICRVANQTLQHLFSEGVTGAAVNGSITYTVT